MADQRVAASSDYGSHRDAVTTTAAQTRRSGSDDTVGYRVPIALAVKASASTPKQPTRHPPVNR